MTAEQACVPALRAAGFDPADVVYVLQSHLHLDHTGALGAINEFPNAQVIATRDEYEYAFAPDWFAAGGYIQKDFNKTGVPWALLEPTEDGYDVFGDGTIRCWRSPGHAPGHQSFEITLRKQRRDAADGRRRVHHRPLGGEGAARGSWRRWSTPSGRCASCTGSRTASNATVVTGHDPDAWPRFKHVPEAYD